MIGASEDYLEQIESEVYQTNGTAAEILTRAKSCIERVVRNDDVRTSDTAPGMGRVAGDERVASIPGGPVLVAVRAEEGAITAHSRVDFTSTLRAYNAKSTLTFLAKEGRFKIRHTEIEVVQKNTGLKSNAGYIRVARSWGTGWQSAEQALASVSDRVAGCVRTRAANDNW